MAFPHRLGGDESEEALILNEITRQYIKDNLNANVPTLALRKAPVGTDVSLALRQIEARQLLHKKVPEWSCNEDLLFPSHLSIEQCSSEATARYKAGILRGNTLVDLTGGLGIDSYYLSQSFQEVDYVELQPELCCLAKHNFEVLQTPIRVWNVAAEDYLQHCKPIDCIYIDPARRDVYGRKTVSISDCVPNVLELQETLMQIADTVMIKLSPMLDIKKAMDELKSVSEVHVLAVGNECKELVFVLRKGFMGQPILYAANLMTQQPILHFTYEEERSCTMSTANDVERYLYEPNAALMKAGCYKLLARWFNVLKLHKNSHLYTSNTLIPDFAGRIFEVENCAPFNKKAKQVLLADVEEANLTVRNFPLSVDALRKSLKIKEGGDVYLFATTIREGEKILIKTKKSVS